MQKNNQSYSRSTACLAAVLLLQGAARAESIAEEQFNRLSEELRLKNQPWAKVTWHTSVTKAREWAAQTRKPMFLVVNTGNCLGFV